MAFIRPYEAFDRADVYDVCVRTAAAGGDARGLYRDDDLMPDVFAGPYLLLEPELAFVLDDGDRAVGYVLGTADTAHWVEEHRRRWLPLVAARHPLPAVPGSPDAPFVELLHHPERNLHPELVGYPAHLHIDLLPEHQGAGHGRGLVRAFLAALRERGVPALHLGMDPANTSARAFYERLGFHDVPVADGGAAYLGIATDAPV
ncbi:GNAT family N-acetyltransferase [Cellulomonas sp. NS3]|uniref:GNAT family N-acetyltransferase n=1 Tax=Cellulomonas sp. NS3 TaxID=2973977 RepID=UPI002163AE33|nr:GNAT family N-acetyltransferase [Cellulomonas sp. NS3]